MGRYPRGSAASTVRWEIIVQSVIVHNLQFDTMLGLRNNRIGRFQDLDDYLWLKHGKVSASGMLVFQGTALTDTKIDSCPT